MIWPYANKENRFKFVYHTIAIEGNTLTYKEVIDVIQTGKAPGGADVAELSEIVGMEAAIKLVNRTIPYPITEDHIMNLHRRILGPVDPDNAGQYRTGCQDGSALWLPQVDDHRERRTSTSRK